MEARRIGGKLNRDIGSLICSCGREVEMDGFKR